MPEAVCKFLCQPGLTPSASLECLNARWGSDKNGWALPLCQAVRTDAQVSTRVDLSAGSIDLAAGVHAMRELFAAEFPVPDTAVAMQGAESYEVRIGAAKTYLLTSLSRYF